MKVYEYGALEPITNIDFINEQMRLAHRYYNSLTEIEHIRRDEYNDLMRDYEEFMSLDDLKSALEDDINDLRQQIRNIRKVTRCRADTASINEEIVRLLELLATTRSESKRAKIEARQRSEEPLKRMNKNDLVRRKGARAACGVYWGTYTIVEDAIEASRKRSIQKPRFRKWDGSGHLSVQIQNGMNAKEAFHKNTRFFIDPVPPNTWDSRKICRHQMKTFCHMRVGSDEKRYPIFAKIPIYLHRRLPDDALIKRVHLIREKLADRYRWKIQISIETNTVKTHIGNYSNKTPIVKSTYAVGVDIGWRIRPNGLRVAYWYNSAGHHGEFVLSDALISSLTKSDSLRSIRDRMLEDLKLALIPSIRQLMDDHRYYVPEWLAEEFKTMSSWRSKSRFSSLAQKWESERFDGDELSYLSLSSWAQQDKHLWEWEVNQRDKSMRRRRDEYRNFAAQLAYDHGEIILEGEHKKGRVMDLRPMCRRSLVEDEISDLNENVRHNRFLAATSILRSSLIQAFQNCGRNIRIREYRNTTRECNSCHVTLLRSEDLYQRCSCGAYWDQDENAARNLVDARSNGPLKHLGQDLVTQKVDGKWSRRKSKNNDLLKVI